jgi:hypothetical protein
MIQGKVTDYGDLLHVEQWLIKGRRLNLVWNIGAPSDTSPIDRTHQPPAPRTGKADTRMDLQADKKVALSVGYTDEVGNSAQTPDGASVTYTVDDPSIINLTDNGDGTASAAATGTLGQATVHVVATVGAQQLSGDLLIVVVPGLAERVNVVAGDITEVTPDA